MRQCPHCGATIEENARFCLYCMTALDAKESVAAAFGKRRRWLWVLPAGVLLLGALFLPGWLAGGDKPLPTGGAVSDALSAPAAVPPQGEASTAPEAAKPESSSAHTPDSSLPAGSPESSSAHTPDSSRPQASAGTTTGTTSSTRTTVPPTGTATTASPSSADSTVLPPAAAVCQWHYVVATAIQFDPEIAGVPVGEGIILTGFDRIPEDGVYVLPASIDGKRVVGCSAPPTHEGKYTFRTAGVREKVKQVYLPPTLYSMPDLSECSALTDVYIASEVIWAPRYGCFSGRTNGHLTLHASTTCAYYITDYEPPDRLQDYCATYANGLGAIFAPWDRTEIYPE